MNFEFLKSWTCEHLESRYIAYNLVQLRHDHYSNHIVCIKIRPISTQLIIHVKHET